MEFENCTRSRTDDEKKRKIVQRKLSKAATETLAIIAYHQPVTRAEVEDIRGVQFSPGTLDILMELNWVRPIGRKSSWKSYHLWDN